jgi:CheY-like chemotaxis protein
MAVDGDDAIQLFDEHVETIDMALLDVVMPRVGGKVVADHILKRRPNIPILFCSGYRSDSIHTNFIQDDQLELLPKPYRRSDLLLKVREVIDNAKQ